MAGGQKPKKTTMCWRDLLSRERLEDLPPSHGTAREPYEIDQDIIINSQPFRRLQDKTQVHPLSENDHVRRRLTHSLEVASIGRALGVTIAKRLKALPRKGAELGFEAADLGNIMYAACLAHDIGNPPFGHLGEDAIREAFKALIDETESLDLSEPQKKDLQMWEGNAQGFRILTR